MAKTRVGIDISHWQGEPNFDKIVKDNDNITFVLVKATQGTNYVDPELTRNIRESERVGLDNGAYHFATFRNKAEAIQEAAFFVSKIKGYKLEEGVALDLEANRGGLGRKALTDATLAFMDYVAAHQNNPVKLYINKNYYDNLLDMSRILPKYELWGARYGTSASGMSGIDMWQYTDKGKVDGISGYVDMNIDYVFDETKANTVSKVSNAVSKTPKRTSGTTGTYTVKNGDTLSEIASDLGVSMNNLIDWNNLSNPNVIRVGQVLKTKKPTTKAKASTPTKTYVVKSGDTLSEIAAKYSTTVANLQKLNNIKDKDVIVIGERLKVPTKAVSSTKTVTVKSGDTVSELATKYGSSVAQVKSWNKLDKNYTIYVGQRLRVK